MVNLLFGGLNGQWINWADTPVWARHTWPLLQVKNLTDDRHPVGANPEMVVNRAICRSRFQRD